MSVLPGCEADIWVVEQPVAAVVEHPYWHMLLQAVHMFPERTNVSAGHELKHTPALLWTLRQNLQWLGPGPVQSPLQLTSHV